MSILFQNLAQAQLQKLFTEYWKRVESERMAEAQKLWYWYIRDKEQVTLCIKAALRKIFKDKSIAKMNIRYFLIVDRILDRLAKVYKQPAARKLDGGIKIGVSGDGTETQEQSKDDVTYQELLEESTLARDIKEFEKQLNLFNVCFLQPMWRDDGDGGYMDFVLHNPAWTVIEWDEENYLKPTAFYYPTWVTVNGMYQQVLVYWSTDEHFYIDRTGNRYQVPGMAGMTNPYKVLPLAVGRIKKSTDGYGEGLWELIEGNEEVCVQVTNLYNTALWQTHGQPVAINMGLVGEPIISPDSPIVVENATGSLTGGQASDFKFVSANPMVKEVQDMINWTIGMLQNLKGMTGQSISLDPVIQSGISKIQDAAELQEFRQDMVTVLEEFEYSLFGVTRAVWNYHNPGKAISEKAKFSVHFAEPKVLKSTDEKIKERDAALKNGTGSRIDFIMEDNPEMNREDAMQKLEQNLAENRRFEDKFGIMDTANMDNQNTNQPSLVP